MRSFFHASRVATLVSVAVALACGGSTYPNSETSGSVSSGGAGGGGGGASGTTVTVSNNMFTPDNVTVPLGSSVTFKWDACSNDGYGSSTCAKHTVTFSDGTTSDTLSTGSYSRSFGSVGTYSYHCLMHGTYMSGTVVVK